MTKVAPRGVHATQSPGYGITPKSQARDSRVMALDLCIIVHHLVWLKYANNERMGCGIVVIDRNRCAILG